MGSSLKVFLASLVMIATIVWIGVLWIGPNLVNLAFLDENRNQPYAVLDLVDTPSQEKYTQVLAELVSTEGGYVDPDYALLHLMEGRRDVKFPQMQVIIMEQGKSLVQVLTASEYQNALEVDQARAIKLGSFSLPLEIWPNTVVVWLAQLRAEGHLDALSELSLAENLGGGQIIWNASVDILVKQNTQWNRLLVVGYEDAQQALDWLRQDDMVITRQIAKANAREFALAIYSR